MKMYPIVVLSDEDTWTTLDRCSILVITEAQLNMLDMGMIRTDELLTGSDETEPAVARISLRDMDSSLF